MPVDHEKRLMKGKKPLKILHVPGNVGGNPQAITRTERRFGVESHSVALNSSVFAYPGDEILWAPGTGLLRREFKRLGLIWRAAREFDVIHYNFGTTIADPPYPVDKNRHNRYPAFLHWPYWYYTSRLQIFELHLMKKLGKVIFVTYQGNDARQGDYCRDHFDISTYEAGGTTFYSPAWDEEKRRRIKMFDRFADKIYALNPDLMHVLPERTEFLPYANVDLEDWLPVEAQNKHPHLVHAPSNRGMKGTQYILDAVEKLQQEGVKFTFELVENIPNSQARLIYEKADLLVDQLLVGWYGGLALEFMALGKPVICYMREDDQKFITKDMRENLPIIKADPDTIFDVLKVWLTNSDAARKKQGARSRKFVEHWHDQNRLVSDIVTSYVQASTAKSDP